ncbi:MAG: thiamine-phosphate kinase [Alphaproteobacteria bacterium]
MPKSTHTTLGDLGEAGALEALKPFVAASGKGNVLVGFGDDAAVVRAGPRAGHLLLTTDLLVEGVHFVANRTDWRALGRKAIAVNASDIAAMGGRPAEALVSIGAPSEWPLVNLKALYRGLAYEARRFGAALVGGDTVRAQALTINVALLGRTEPGRKPALRSECRAGQNLYLTGTAGDSAAGLRVLVERRLARFRSQSWAKTLIRRHNLPTARVEAGCALTGAFKDLAMIDVSDGVSHEADLLTRASGAAIELDARALPLSPALCRFGREARQPTVAYALHGGEDYELLFATQAALADVRACLKRHDVRLRVTQIGRVASGPRATPRLDILNAPEGGPGEFEHFHVVS